MEDEFENKYVHTFYNRKAQKFSCSRVKPWPFTLQFIEKYTKGDDIVLDAGCGNGRQFIHKNTVGVDFSENLLVDASQKAYLGLIKANVLSLPFQTNCFDIVLSIAVIHHLSTHERRLEAMAEIKRVMKKEGHCLIYMWHKEASRKAKFAKFSENNSDYFVSWSGETDILRYYCLFDEQMLTELINESGMQIIEMRREEESLYAVIKNKEPVC